MTVRVYRQHDGNTYQDSLSQSFAIEIVEVLGHSEFAEQDVVLDEMFSAVRDLNDNNTINGSELRRGSPYFGQSPNSNMRVWSWKVIEPIGPTHSLVQILFLVDNEAFGFPPNTRIVGSSFTTREREVPITYYKSVSIAGVTFWLAKPSLRPRSQIFKREFVYLVNQTEITIDGLVETVASRLGSIYASAGSASIFYKLTGAQIDPTGSGNYTVQYWYIGEETWRNVPQKGTQIAVPTVLPFGVLTVGWDPITGDPQYEVELPEALYWTAPGLPNSAMETITAAGWELQQAPAPPP